VTGAMESSKTPAERLFEDVARSAGPRVLAYLARRTDPAADAADVYQAVLVTAWRKIGQLPEDPEHALGWLLAVARRELANHRRGSLRRIAATDRLRDHLTTSLDGAPGICADSRAQALEEALTSLDPGEREILTLVYWDRLSGTELAAALDISEPAARKRLQRARASLTARLPALAQPSARASVVPSQPTLHSSP